MSGNQNFGLWPVGMRALPILNPIPGFEQMVEAAHAEKYFR